MKINLIKTKALTLLISLFCLEISAQESLKIGDKAPEISTKTIDGKDFNLGSLKGKIVLLDFWATWCAPCVEEQPELKKLNLSLKNYDFELIGFSLDKNKESWEKVVKRLEIDWTQIGDLKFWKSPVAKDYAVSELPYNLIIDKDGTILKINLHGKELEEYLTNLFSTQ